MPDLCAHNTVLAIVAQNPGADEERGQRIVGWNGPRQPIYEPCAPQPLIGTTGWDVRKSYLPLTVVPEEHVSFLNILKCRLTVNGRRTNDLPNGRVLNEAVSHCMKHHFKVPDDTKMILALGSLAWKSLGGKGSILEWRGFVSDGLFEPVRRTDQTREGALVRAARLASGHVHKEMVSVYEEEE